MIHYVTRYTAKIWFNPLLLLSDDKNCGWIHSVAPRTTEIDSCWEPFPRPQYLYLMWALICRMTLQPVIFTQMLGGSLPLVLDQCQLFELCIFRSTVGICVLWMKEHVDSVSVLSWPQKSGANWCGISNPSPSYLYCQNTCSSPEAVARASFTGEPE